MKTNLVDAARAGQIRFNTGKECPRNHRKPTGEVEDRSTLSNGHCLQCHAENTRALRAKRKNEFKMAVAKRAARPMIKPIINKGGK